MNLVPYAWCVRRAKWLYRVRRERQYRRSDPEIVISSGCCGCSSPETLHLYSVAFANPAAIRHQIRLLDKYLADPFELTVVDNSPQGCAREEIASVCRENAVTYVGLAANPFARRWGSSSHGAALNWAYFNLVAPAGHQYFGFIDHDIQPFKKTQVLPLLSHCGVFGLIQERGRRWYLWPGFCFFSARVVGHRGLDFMPNPPLDTGGGNWRALFRAMPRALLPRVTQTYGMLNNGVLLQSSGYELIGDWVHTMNASEWTPAPGKQMLVDRFLSDM